MKAHMVRSQGPIPPGTGPGTPQPGSPQPGSPQPGSPRPAPRAPARDTRVGGADAQGIAHAAQRLKAGGLVAFPTETVYGLGADATNPHAVAALYAAKGRPAFNPLISHLADREQAFALGAFSPDARRLAEAFWPGPLTLVVPYAGGGRVCDLARAGLDTIALRVPAHPLAQALIAAFGGPVVAPSANRSGHVSPTTPEHVLDDMAGLIDLVMAGGETRVGVESTILDLTGGTPRLLRPGGLTRDTIEARLGAPLADAAPGDAARPAAPGRLASHYAPRARVRLEADAVAPGEALLTFAGARPPGSADAATILDLSPGGDLAEAAAHLYGALRRLDASGAPAIAVVPLPRAGLGEAIADRLARAAAPRPSSNDEPQT
jgi:L-threonylcarbamoyladenylate synthase